MRFLFEKLNVKEINNIMENKKKTKMTFDISEDTKKMLDEISSKTGIVKGFIIEEGIKIKCKEINELYGFETKE